MSYELGSLDMAGCRIVTLRIYISFHEYWQNVLPPVPHKLYAHSASCVAVLLNMSPGALVHFPRMLSGLKVMLLKALGAWTTPSLCRTGMKKILPDGAK